MGRLAYFLRLLGMCFFAIFSGTGAQAVERVGFFVAGGNKDLEKELRAASVVLATVAENRTVPRDILSAALADYARLLETLYATGHYSAVIQIRLNGREAATIPLLAVPEQVEQVEIRIDPGRPFRFGRTGIAPRAPGSAPSPAFATGQPAQSGAVREAVDVAVDGWRAVGHAKAAPVGQRVVADHQAATLDAQIQLNPGPRVRFGDLVITTPSAVRAERIARIVGLPSGTVFSPETLARVAKRLRRTGAFSSVSLGEAEALGPGDTLDITLALADEKPRRFGFGAELSSLEGISLSGFWLHRNVFGGAERLRFEGAIDQIGGAIGGIDYSAGARLEIPAIFGPDTTGFANTELAHLEEPGFASDAAEVGAGVTWFLTDELQAEAGVGLTYSQTDDAFGAREFTLLTFPAAVTWDKRDNALNPAGGQFLNLQATPFMGLSGSASGARIYGDARAYRALGGEDGVVLAGRLQFGSVQGASLTGTHPDFLFFSGGGGTVRGQPYQSLDVDLGGGMTAGGRSFVGMSLEARVPVTDRIGAVAFADAGYIGAESFHDGSGNWHSGAGIGLRYKTGLGPIRFDVAAPVGGSTGSGVQIYIGIGQAF